MLLRAQGLVRLSSFTIDLKLLTEALKARALRSLPVELYADHSHSMSGTTGMQMARLDDMRRAGVDIFLVRGIANGGNQHSKTCMSEGVY